MQIDFKKSQLCICLHLQQVPAPPIPPSLLQRPAQGPYGGWVTTSDVRHFETILVWCESWWGLPAGWQGSLLRSLGFEKEWQRFVWKPRKSKNQITESLSCSRAASGKLDGWWPHAASFNGRPRSTLQTACECLTSHVLTSTPWCSLPAWLWKGWEATLAPRPALRSFPEPPKPGNSPRQRWVWDAFALQEGHDSQTISNNYPSTFHWFPDFLAACFNCDRLEEHQMFFPDMFHFVCTSVSSNNVRTAFKSRTFLSHKCNAEPDLSCPGSRRTSSGRACSSEDASPSHATRNAKLCKVFNAKFHSDSQVEVVVEATWPWQGQRFRTLRHLKSEEKRIESKWHASPGGRCLFRGGPRLRGSAVDFGEYLSNVWRVPGACRNSCFLRKTGTFEEYFWTLWLCFWKGSVAEAERWRAPVLTPLDLDVFHDKAADCNDFLTSLNFISWETRVVQL